jgi:hypothetical protein
MINQKNLTNEIDIFRLKREKNLILKSKIFNLKINIVFFGASSALNKIWNIFLEQSIIPDYICDNDANKHGKSFNGYLISHPDDIFNKNELYLVFITSSFFNQILYGYGHAGKIFYENLSKNIVAIVDKNHLSDNNLFIEIENLNNIEYDCILISVLGREDEISSYLYNNYNIKKDKIITINL